MNSKTFIRLMILVVAMTGSIMLLSASYTKKNKDTNKQECPSGKESCDDTRTQGDIMLWESITRHLMTTK